MLSGFGSDLLAGSSKAELTFQTKIQFNERPVEIDLRYKRRQIEFHRSRKRFAF